MIKKFIIKWIVKFLAYVVETVADVIGSVLGPEPLVSHSVDYESHIRKALGIKDDSDQQIRNQIRKIRSIAEKVTNEDVLVLGKKFLETAAWGDDQKIQVFVEEGFPITYQDPKTGSTALHRAAACMARDVVRVLIKSDKCDFLIRDNKGRLPSEMAYLYGHDPALARLLGIKERKQAEEQGIKLTRRPPPEAKP